MNCPLPYWMQMLQALAVPAIALLAAVIGYFQWRTAHNRVVIDLFDRRMKIFTDCRDILQPIIASPSVTTTQDGIKFLRASADAGFLFGDKVVKHLERVEQAIFDLATCEAELKPTPVGQARTDLVAKSRKATEIVMGFYNEEFRSLLRPYMRLKQRLWW
jgi:hypothetical protein